MTAGTYKALRLLRRATGGQSAYDQCLVQSHDVGGVRMRWFLVASVAAAVLLVAGCTVWRLNEARQLARASEPFEQSPANARVHMLVVGDSTGVGTGASSPAASLAGLLGAAYPSLAIRNLARDGARFEAVPGQIRAATAPAAGFDVILVSAGGNDVIRNTDADALARAVALSFVAARERLAADGLLLVQPAGNVGNAPFFPPPLSSLMNQRAAQMHQVVRSAAAAHGAVVVNMAREAEQDPFVQNKALNASDGLHPSDEGYKLWRDELFSQSELAAKLAPAK